MKKYETRDQLIARTHRESQLTGVAALICIVKNLLNRHELVETRDEAIARLHNESIADPAKNTNDVFDEYSDPFYSWKINNTWNRHDD